MKKLLLIISLSVFASFVFAQSQKTLVKSFNLKKAETIVVNLDGKVTIQEWDNTSIQVHLNIELANSNQYVLKHFVTSGRYSLTSNKAGNALTILNKTDLKPIKIKENLIEENIEYTIFIPKNINIEIQQNKESL